MSLATPSKPNAALGRGPSGSSAALAAVRGRRSSGGDDGRRVPAGVQHGFINFDDGYHILDNTRLRSLDGLRQNLARPCRAAVLPDHVHAVLDRISFVGRAPLGYHVVNLALHAASVVLLWRVLLRLNVPGAWLAAAVFAVHPIAVESVAWATELKNVLSLALALGSLLWYLRYREKLEAAAENDRFPAAVAYCLAHRLVHRRGAEQDHRRHAAGRVVGARLVAARSNLVATRRSTGCAVLRRQRCAGTGDDVGRKHSVGATGMAFNLTPFERLLVAGRIPWFYAANLFWPVDLSFFYPRWHVDSAAAWQYVFPLATVALIAGLALAVKRIGRGPLAAAIIFGGILVPVLGFVNVYFFRYTFVSDHFQYHASIAIIVLTVAAGSTACAARRTTRACATVGVAALLIVLGEISFREAEAYRNSETLFRNVIGKYPDISVAHSNLAQHLHSVGRDDEALEEFRATQRLGPDTHAALFNIGFLLVKSGRARGFRAGELDEAIDALSEVLRQKPDYIDAHNSLALALVADHRPQAAIEHFEEVLKAHPGDSGTMIHIAAR